MWNIIPLAFAAWIISRRHLVIYQLAVLIFCPSSLMVFTNCVFLKKMAYFTFFHWSLYFHNCWFKVIFKSQYFSFLACWNVKKRYAHLIKIMLLKISRDPPSLSSFRISLQILIRSAFWCFVNSWGNQRQTNFFQMQFFMNYFMHSFGFNVKSFCIIS